MATDRIQFRATPALRRQIDQLAADRGTTLSGAIKSAILEAAPPEGGIPTENELLEMLGQAARVGNVTAMKELRAYYSERKDRDTSPNPLAEVDELAARRLAAR